MGSFGTGRLSSSVGDYEIVGTLGSGAFGHVYEAIDLRTEERVAIKELTRATARALAHFKQEFRALADLHHPNLVGLRGLFEHDERWYIAMELVEGEDLLSHVRRGAEGEGPSNSNGYDFDEPRLRRAFHGIARGLAALHEHGFLHRDLKPSNIRINTQGYAVLLDFGLVTSIDPSAQSVHENAVGTVSYMAPEQARGGTLGVEADWYAFGTCLYEALTGRLPFEGESALRIVLDKQQRTPAAPSTRAGAIPPDLEALCLDLLAIEPADRPRGAEVLERLSLGLSVHELGPELPDIALSSMATFEGRGAELALLERAFDFSQHGELRFVLVEGESGVGKSALVEEFLGQKRLAHPTLVALKGRCYENEQVPYKAFDGCVDELARALARMEQTTAEALLPARAGLLAELFPVLRAVPVFAKQKRVEASADLTARRLEAFSALSALLSKLAGERPLVIVIEDVHWADAESFRLLRALIEGRPRPSLLIVATARPREELEPAVSEHLEALRSLRCTDTVQLLGLPRAQAEELAKRLLGEHGEPGWSSVIAAESRGHPLFLSELVHYTRSHDQRLGGSLTLEAALRARIEQLDAEARELLELVALAARPYGSQLFARALGVSSVEATAKRLLSAKLLRARRGAELGCFHDRIRHVTVSMIAPARLPILHAQLARALADIFHVGSVEQARHWDLAGQPERAVEAYEDAGDQAMSSLAFVRAENLYARAIELLGDTRDERYRRLMVQRAQALSCAGRSGEAAALYARAAELSHGEQRLRLRSRVARHLMQSAQTEPGIRAARELLAEFGLRLPESSGAALRQVAWNRFCLALTGRAYRIRERAADDGAERFALEIVQELASPLTVVAPPLGLALTMQYMRRALRLGDPAHLARACTDEGLLVTLRQSLAKAEPLLELSRKLHADVRNPAALAHAALSEGTCRIVGWDLERARVCLEEAHRVLQAQCAGESWMLTHVRMSLGTLWRNLGEHARLAAEADTWIAEAEERKDPYARATLAGLGFGHLRHLMRDQPERACEELRGALSAIPREPFAYAHLGEFVGMLQALLYAGGDSALTWLRENEERWRGTFLLKTRVGKELGHFFRAMAALRACEGASATEREARLRLVRTSAYALNRIGTPFSLAFSDLLLAQSHALRGEAEPALVAARKARNRLETMGHFGSHAAAYLEGMLEGGTQGVARCERALLVYQDQGWVNAIGGLTLAAPALPLLSEANARAV